MSCSGSAASNANVATILEVKDALGLTRDEVRSKFHALLRTVKTRNPALSQAEAEAVARHKLMETVAESTPHVFTPWETDPTLGVCGRCGKDISHDQHTQRGAPSEYARYAPYKDALWAWTVENGGTRGSFGMHFESTVVFGTHFRTCGIDDSASKPPHIQQMREFDGTDYPEREVDVSAATLTCNCGKLRNVRWVMPRQQTAGEIVYRIVQAGDTLTDTRDRWAQENPTRTKYEDYVVAEVVKADPSLSEDDVRAALPEVLEAFAHARAVEYGGNRYADEPGGFDKETAATWEILAYNAQFVPQVIQARTDVDVRRHLRFNG
jgi:hypothetical protein